jgi:hypothetical protein
MPGFGDPDLAMSDYAKKLISMFKKKKRIDACIIVTKATDLRLSVQEIITMKAIKKFILDVDPDEIYTVFTHCDLQPITEEQIKGKLEGFSKFGGF